MPNFLEIMRKGEPHKLHWGNCGVKKTGHFGPQKVEFIVFYCLEACMTRAGGRAEVLVIFSVHSGRAVDDELKASQP